jgi:hypothetical protein
MAKEHVETTQQDDSRLNKEAQKNKIPPRQGVNDSGGSQKPSTGQQSGQGQGSGDKGKSGGS